MSENKKNESPELDIPGLLSLKTFETPRPGHAEKRIQNIMREVRTAHKKPSLLLFPDKSAGWAFAQPRYGVAALFIIFLGLHLLEHPMPKRETGSPVLTEAASSADITVAALSTNRANSVPVPGIVPAYQSVTKDLATFVNYTE